MDIKIVSYLWDSKSPPHQALTDTGVEGGQMNLNVVWCVSASADLTRIMSMIFSGSPHSTVIWRSTFDGPGHLLEPNVETWPQNAHYHSLIDSIDLYARNFN